MATLSTDIETRSSSRDGSSATAGMEMQTAVPNVDTGGFIDLPNSIAPTHDIDGIKQPTSPRVKSPPADVLKYEIDYKRQLGKGNFGVVYEADRKTPMTPKRVAVKVINLKDKNNCAAAQKEYEYQQKLEHPNIVKVLDLEKDEDEVRIFMELCRGSILNQTYQEDFVRKKTLGVLRAMKQIHGFGLAHGDIKPNNILVSDDGVVKLCDFGSCVKDGDPALSFTPLYLSPEAAFTSRASKASDVWAFGCTVLHMVTGQLKWPELESYEPQAIVFHIGITEELSSDQLSKHHPAIPDRLSPELDDLLKLIFTLDHESRPTVSDLMEHPFFAQEKRLPQRQKT